MRVIFAAVAGSWNTLIWSTFPPAALRLSKVSLAISATSGVTGTSSVSPTQRSQSTLFSRMYCTRLDHVSRSLFKIYKKLAPQNVRDNVLTLSACSVPNAFSYFVNLRHWSGLQWPALRPVAPEQNSRASRTTTVFFGHVSRHFFADNVPVSCERRLSAASLT